jgi:hypothetical protein
LWTLKKEAELLFQKSRKRPQEVGKNIERPFRLAVVCLQETHALRGRVAAYTFTGPGIAARDTTTAHTACPFVDFEKRGRASFSKIAEKTARSREEY